MLKELPTPLHSTVCLGQLVVILITLKQSQDKDKHHLLISYFCFGYLYFEPKFFGHFDPKIFGFFGYFGANISIFGSVETTLSVILEFSRKISSSGSLAAILGSKKFLFRFHWYHLKSSLYTRMQNQTTVHAKAQCEDCNGWLSAKAYTQVTKLDCEIQTYRSY